VALRSSSQPHTGKDKTKQQKRQSAGLNHWREEVERAGGARSKRGRGGGDEECGDAGTYIYIWEFLSAPVTFRAFIYHALIRRGGTKKDLAFALLCILHEEYREYRKNWSFVLGTSRIVMYCTWRIEKIERNTELFWHLTVAVSCIVHEE
jgi:hypothetical protein